MSDPTAVANAFIKHYYTLFDGGKNGIAQLASLYVSLLQSFEYMSMIWDLYTSAARFISMLVK